MILSILVATTLSSVAPAETAYGHIARKDIVHEVAGGLAEGSTEAIVRSYFRDIPVMVEIARCESTFRHRLADGSILRGRVDPDDTGVMQINLRYHRATATRMDLNLEDIYHNMAYARYLYETQGTRPWNASAPCWSRTLAANY